jgi:hypothetical protein
VTPEKIALSVALGAAIGLLPASREIKKNPQA